ncbi:MAG: hypothetical protein VX939_04865 [Pseudomonadota bacterium]|nr:hypothetical protein [Pseudomonadota bacterium]
MTEGRSCPLAYRYQPDALCQDPVWVNDDVIYVIGGLYGNTLALDEIERMAQAEEQAGHRVRLVFNGDFNWFNASDELFRSINSRVLDHTVTLGNVDYELALPNDGAGCGCAYPEFVDQGVVARSNAMIQTLKGVADRHLDLCKRLSVLPRYRCLFFGGLKILVLHGDPESLAGWGLSHEAFAGEYLENHRARLHHWFEATGADVMVCTHTCLPVLWRGDVAGVPRAVANNGSAGMGNLAGDSRGLVTRIALSSPFQAPVAGIQVAGLNIALMPVAFDAEKWLETFDQLWPEGSPAAVSYRRRLASGTGLRPEGIVFDEPLPT